MISRFIFTTIFLSFSVLYGTVLENKIENLIGEKEFQIHKNLINLLFKKKERFITSDKINYLNVVQELKNNGLLKLRFKRPQNIQIEFQAINKSFKAYKILTDTMKSLGYSYYFTKRLEKSNNILTLNIELKTEYMIDPVVFVKELKLKNCDILEIERKSSKSWYYKIDFNNAILTDALKIEKNEKVKFQKPLKPYMLKVNDAIKLDIISHNLNTWYPSITFLNSDLTILKVIHKQRIYKGYKTKVPQDTVYIKITDMYNLINIKRGLTITVR